MQVTDELHFTESEAAALILRAVQKERRRIVGLVLAKFGHARLSSAEDVAQALDERATEIEHGA